MLFVGIPPKNISPNFMTERLDGNTQNKNKKALKNSSKVSIIRNCWEEKKLLYISGAPKTSPPQKKGKAARCFFQNHQVQKYILKKHPAIFYV